MAEAYFYRVSLPENFTKHFYYIMHTLVTLLLLILLSNNVYCQAIDSIGFEQRPTSINEVIQHKSADSVLFYYNDRWQLVKPICATRFRISRVDPILATFTGEFIDYYIDSTKAVEGRYTNGKKEGRFNLYFSNGQLEAFGNYSGNRKTGIWEYFYEDGKKRQVLDFQNNEILINDFWNEEGKKTADSGNGKWFTYESSDKFKKISGEILNGKKHGIWKTTIAAQNFTTNIEKYQHGKLVSGKLISLVGGVESYKDTSYCAIEKAPLFVAAEQFQINRCFKKEENKWEYAKYPGGMDRFYTELKEKLIFTVPLQLRGVIRVQTMIRGDGRMTNFKPVSDLGYEQDLIRALETMGNWIPKKLNGKPTTQAKIISFELR